MKTPLQHRSGVSIVPIACPLWCAARGRRRLVLGAQRTSPITQGAAERCASPRQLAWPCYDHNNREDNQKLWYADLAHTRASLRHDPILLRQVKRQMNAR
jgi:hypothetical protein